MDDPWERNVLCSAAAGVYHLNAFYFRVESLSDLDPHVGEPLPFAVAIHAHEYVHLLHNASTTAGQAYLLSNLVLLRAIAGGCDEQGYFCGIDAMTADQRGWLDQAVALMQTQLGTTAAKELGKCKDVQNWEFELPAVVEGSYNIPSVTTVCRAVDVTGEPVCKPMTLGLHFISEGVAHEVDREIRRLNGMPEFALDTTTKPFPYLAYRVLLRRWSGRELAPRDFIGIGVSALSFPFAGHGLEFICARLRARPDLSLDIVLKMAQAEGRRLSEEVVDWLRKQELDLPVGDVVRTAMTEYMTLIDAGIRMRQQRWAPELEFLSGPMTADLFRARIASMLDCLTIQGKPEKEVEMNWIGPGHIAQTEQTQQSLGALQSAIHFSQLHLCTNGPPIPTAELPRERSCPFVGGCQAERDDGYPEACRLAPWERFKVAPPGTKVCWYAAGVKALRNQGHSSSPA